MNYVLTTDIIKQISTILILELKTKVYYNQRQDIDDFCNRCNFFVLLILYTTLTKLKICNMFTYYIDSE